MSQIRFYLQAEPLFNGKLRVLEYYEVRDGVLYQGGDGLWVERPVSGRVEECIIKSYPKEYEEWKAYLDANDAKLYAEAKEAYQKEHGHV